MGVAKAYCTRVGAGPFPTELNDETGQHLQKKGAEFGATTGRPRRCGWLDLAGLRYTTAINGCTSLCLTKLDVLGGLEKIQLGVAYKLDGQEIDYMPADLREVARLEPIYEEIDGWAEDVSKERELESLPVNARKYIKRIEAFLDIPVDIASVGPARKQTIMHQNPFRRE
jgi:adenylosuccinate synthase